MLTPDPILTSRYGNRIFGETLTGLLFPFMCVNADPGIFCKTAVIIFGQSVGYVIFLYM